MILARAVLMEQRGQKLDWTGLKKKNEYMKSDLWKSTTVDLERKMPGSMMI